MNKIKTEELIVKPVEEPYENANSEDERFVDAAKIERVVA